MFRIEALPYAPFAPLFALDDPALARRRTRRVVADRATGFPCRVSLEDAAVGETLILTHHVHHDTDTPFHASHAVYVREDAVQAEPATDEVPAMLRSRMLSLRGFDAGGMMRSADVVEGSALEEALDCMLADADLCYVHLHAAKPGCYLATARRA